MIIIWNISIFFIVFLVMLQITLGKYPINAYAPILWLIISVTPMTFIIRKYAIYFNIIAYYILYGYIFCLFLVLFSEPIFSKYTELSSQDVLFRSLIMIAFFNIFICFFIFDNKKILTFTKFTHSREKFEELLLNNDFVSFFTHIDNGIRDGKIIIESSDLITYNKLKTEFKRGIDKTDAQYPERLKVFLISLEFII